MTETLLTSARVGDRLVDLRVVDGVIRGIAASIAAPDAQVIDLDGRWVVPGLWDEHVHFGQWALYASRLDLSGATSAAGAAALVRARLARGDAPHPLVGVGFRDGLWADEPTRQLLDAVTGAHPVVLLSGDLHCVWLNSAALEMHGRGEHPTGLLREDDAFAIEQAVDALEPAELDRLVGDAARVAASRGVVGIVDLEMTWALDTWRRRVAAGFDALRVEFGVYRGNLDRAIELGLRTGEPLDALLTVGRFKILIDGSLNTRTAYCDDAFPGGGHGMLVVPPEELVPLLHQATDAGIEASVHAIGDHAVALALDAFAAVGTARAGLGGRIEHAQLVRTADLPRFAELGVAASVQPEHAMDDRDVADRYWAGRGSRVIPVRSLLDAGARVLFGSDAPVAPLDPWVTMAAAVTRARDGRAPWHPEQTVTPDEALAASARTSIAVGRPADLVAVDADPRDGSALRTMPVAATWLAGRPTFSAL
ncbi:amidohydrolase [Galbitalea sp. SE-J8]|uniref:amidohydrolase n=1 Tax=Galbitalea sp. SE-J8 TaxID=3054952 RepID=UPI00259C9A96|nr:amidohydrolase [Galbitalea sp. SE-J8]MDM4764086.1 amidohydrolase [Galbitalea sp. SE-J8]